MKALVTGGAGFIGSALVRSLIATTDYSVLNFDNLTYAGNLRSLSSVENHPRYRFVKGDIQDESLVRDLFETFRPTIVTHLAAESHVDDQKMFKEFLSWLGCFANLCYYCSDKAFSFIEKHLFLEFSSTTKQMLFSFGFSPL